MDLTTHTSSLSFMSSLGFAARLGVVNMFFFQSGLFCCFEHKPKCFSISEAKKTYPPDDESDHQHVDGQQQRFKVTYRSLREREKKKRNE